jgi:hypothetical protein
MAGDLNEDITDHLSSVPLLVMLYGVTLMRHSDYSKMMEIIRKRNETVRLRRNSLAHRLTMIREKGLVNREVELIRKLAYSYPRSIRNLDSLNRWDGLGNRIVDELCHVNNSNIVNYPDGHGNYFTHVGEPPY